MTPMAEAFLAAMRDLESRPLDIPTEPTVLPAWLYDAAKAEGIDLSGCIKQEPIPELT